jgi:hypothetical protein
LVVLKNADKLIPKRWYAVYGVLELLEDFNINIVQVQDAFLINNFDPSISKAAFELIKDADFVK